MLCVSICFVLLFGLAVLVPPVAGNAADNVPAPSGLLCDLLSQPELVELTDSSPRFSWVVNSNEPNDVQTAYQIAVAPTLEMLRQSKGLVWDSGSIASDRSVAVIYDGPALQAHHDYWWRVRIRDRQGAESDWSEAQHFRIGEIEAVRPIGEGVARLPLTQTAVEPVRVNQIEPGHYFLDFGRDAFAALRLTLSGTAGGGPIVVHMGEAESGENNVNRTPPGSVRYHRAEISLEPGIHTYTVPLTEKDARRMPPAIGPVMPFRYVEIESYTGAPLTTHDAVQMVAHYPFSDTAARFTSSDSQLNDVWDLCRYSMKATSFCGIFVDGDRERLPYEADAYINQLGWYCCAGEYALPRYTAEDLILHPTWPTEWFFHSVMMAWTDYLYTGDGESLRRCYDELKPKTLIDLAGSDGLVRTVHPPVPATVLAAVHARRMQNIVDWPPSERDGYVMQPENTVVNAFYYRALLDMAAIAAETGHADDAATYSTAATKVASALNSRMFDATTGLYVDGIGTTHSSLHANLFPLAFGLVPPDRVAKVAAFVRSRGMACSVYAAQYLMEALYATGQGAYALDLTLAPGDRSWAHMAHGIGTTITTEAWDQHYKPNQDWNHAWGAAPANVIPRLLMGVEPIEPGFRTVRVRPQPGSLKNASLDLPTIRGPIHVDFKSQTDRFTLNVVIPANVRAEISLPVLGKADDSVVVDGKRLTGRRDGDFVVIAPVGSGAHTLVRE